ncbi:hypothetical protein HYX18_03305 [Candidatus Woesearchaeota archaeon]|nr:hypothetical protein [Candidatus Woesearchaeota archaeon]
MTINDQEIQEILNKYRDQLRSKVGKVDVASYTPNRDFSREYLIFRKELLGNKITLYEKLCNFSEKIIKINPDKKEITFLKKSIEVAHFNISYIGVASFATLIGFTIVVLGLIYGIIQFIATKSVLSLLLPLLLMLFGVLLIRPLTKIPNYIASRWRLKASNQMVLCILYIVMYMRHTSNLEHALKFAIDHIQEPLSLDLRKVFFDVENGKYGTLKESLDNYLESWREYNLEFVNSFHLIEGSLYEPTESRRIELLDKSLDLILTGTYEKMLHYAQNLKNPITMIHMLGVVLPILGLVILPLVSSFIKQASVDTKITFLVFLYNIFLPITVYILGSNLLSKRPTGYGESIVSIKNKGNVFISLVIVSFFVFIGLLPILLYAINNQTEFNFGLFGKFFDYKCFDEICRGPYGVGSLIFSLFVPFGIAFGLGYYFKSKTKQSIKIREETKILEQEFSGSLFQLGNRIGDGVPSEVAIENIADNMKGTPTGNFFRTVSNNIRNLGQNVEEAIFNLKNGAILRYQSPLVESSMEVLVESSRKGPSVVARSLISISNYVSQIHSVNERLKDLLSDVISSMRSQISFLAPVIAAIVVGIASMIVNVIGKLGDLVANANLESTSDIPTGGLDAISGFLSIYDTIPGYFFQIIIGLYVVEIVYVLTVLANGIENGADKVNEQYLLGKNLQNSVLLYIAVALIVILIFNALASLVLTATNI